MTDLKGVLTMAFLPVVVIVMLMVMAKSRQSQHGPAIGGGDFLAPTPERRGEAVFVLVRAGLCCARLTRFRVERIGSTQQSNHV
jgi:hypothetical protein